MHLAALGVSVSTDAIPPICSSKVRGRHEKSQRILELVYVTLLQ